MDLIAKLSFRGQRPVVILDAPPEAAPALIALGADALTAPDAARPAAFALAFVTDETEIARATAALLPALAEDAPLWFAYPKKSSKRHRATISRDAGWAPLGAAGFEGVRQVALDAHWSALRFRHVRHIPRLTRDPARALSAEGRRRVSEGDA